MKAPQRTTWRKTSVQGLYELRPADLPETVRGRFYSRYSVNGRRTFRSLETNVWEHAKIKHAEKAVLVEKDRRRGADLGSEFKTLGALYEEMAKRLTANPVAKNTEVGRKNCMARLRTHWRRGKFEIFLARNVTADVVTELRDYLLSDAPWHYHFGRTKKGFKAPVVNQTLWVLRVMLDIAVEKSVIVENPFAVSSVLRGTLFAQGRRVRGKTESVRSMKVDQIPSRPDMMRIIDEMRRLPANSKANPEQRVHLQQVADELADHTALLAFSGMRKAEAKASTVADDLGDEFKIWGTKSAASVRTIPVTSALREVLDRIRNRRLGPKTKLVLTAEPGRALKRACERLGLPPMRNHDLRHFFASACISSGVDIPTVSRWLGHADGGALCMKVYGHLLKDHSRAAAQRVNFTGSDSAVQVKTA